jgi:serine/threonine protein kinase
MSELITLLFLSSQSLLALKICTSNRISQEVQIAHHLQSLDPNLEEGLSCLRIPLDDFEVSTVSGRKHTVMVFTPLDLTWNQIQKQYKAAGVGMPKAQIQYGLCLLLCGLNILHEAGIVHTDLYPNNIMFAIANKSTWSRIAQSEKETPSPRKVLSDRSIYQSHDIPDAQCVPPPIIADFGHARMGELGQKYRGRIMPDFYRAPEVILGMEWDCKVDMWSVGLMVCRVDPIHRLLNSILTAAEQIWDLFEGSRLFHAVKDGRLSDELHLAEMVALMGPPPKAFLERSEECSKYWDAEGESLHSSQINALVVETRTKLTTASGNWIASTPIPDQTFESLEVRLEGEDKELLLAFARKVLRWLPEERKSAGEFLEEGDDFLTQWGVTEAEL